MSGNYPDGLNQYLFDEYWADKLDDAEAAEQPPPDEPLESWFIPEDAENPFADDICRHCGQPWRLCATDCTCYMCRVAARKVYGTE